MGTTIHDRVQIIKNTQELDTSAGGGDELIPKHGETHVKTGSDPVPPEIDGIETDMTGIADGQVPTYDSAQDKFLPTTPGSGGSTPTFDLVDFTTGLADPAHKEGRTFWDDAEKALAYFNDKTDVKMGLGRETWVRVRNDTGAQIDNGEVVYVSGAQGNLPEISLAVSTEYDKDSVLAVATMDIPDGTEGEVTRIGPVNDVDLSAFSNGDKLYLSPTTPGGLTNTRPTFPGKPVIVGYVVNNGVSGRMIVVIENDQFDYEFDGCAIERQDTFVVESGGTVYAETELLGGGDLPVQLEGDVYLLDCTTGSGTGGRARVALTAGTDTAPQINFVFVKLVGGVPTLQSSVTAPTGAFAFISFVSIWSAAKTVTDGPALHQRNTDAIEHDGRGRIAHICAKLRQLGASWSTGVTPTATITTRGGALDDLDVEVTSGLVWQLHPQAFPALASASDGAWVANASGLGTLTKYQKITNLNQCLEYADGSSVPGGQRYNLVLWGAVNKTTGECKLFVNLPTKGYGNNDDGYYDAEGSAVLSVDRALFSVAFLIARIPVRYRTLNGGTFEFINPSGYPEIVTLLGTPISSSGSSGGGGGGGASNLNDLDDVEITTPADGDILEYETATSLWKNIPNTGAYWTRTGTELSPTNSGDSVKLDGPFNVYNGVFNVIDVTAAGALTMQVPTDEDFNANTYGTGTMTLTSQDDLFFFVGEDFRLTYDNNNGFTGNIIFRHQATQDVFRMTNTGAVQLTPRSGQQFLALTQGGGDLRLISGDNAELSAADELVISSGELTSITYNGDGTTHTLTIVEDTNTLLTCDGDGAVAFTPASGQDFTVLTSGSGVGGISLEDSSGDRIEFIPGGPAIQYDAPIHDFKSGAVSLLSFSTSIIDITPGGNTGISIGTEGTGNLSISTAGTGTLDLTANGDFDLVYDNADASGNNFRILRDVGGDVLVDFDHDGAMTLTPAAGAAFTLTTTAGAGSATITLDSADTLALTGQTVNVTYDGDSSGSENYRISRQPGDAGPVFKCNPDGKVEIAPLSGENFEVTTAGVGVINFKTDRFNVGASNDAFRFGEEVYDVDFTGTDYDTDAEMYAAGFKLSDDSTNNDFFPTRIVPFVGSSWSHSAGNGWQTTDPLPIESDTGPAIIIPLMRSHDWEAELTFTCPTFATGHHNTIHFGAMAHGGVPVWYCEVVNEYNTYFQAQLLATVAGSTAEPIGTQVLSSMSGSNFATNQTSYTVKIRSLNGCVGAWDDVNDTWYKFESRFPEDSSTGVFPALVSHLFIQVTNEADTRANYDTPTLTGFKLTYLS